MTSVAYVLDHVSGKQIGVVVDVVFSSSLDKSFLFHSLSSFASGLLQPVLLQLVLASP